MRRASYLFGGWAAIANLGKEKKKFSEKERIAIALMRIEASWGAKQ